MRRPLSLFVVGVALIGVTITHAATAIYRFDYTQLPTAPASTFHVLKQELCTGPIMTITAAAVQLTGSFTQDITDITLKTNTDYCVSIIAATAAGLESAPSNTVRFQLQETPSVPMNLRIAR